MMARAGASSRSGATAPSPVVELWSTAPQISGGVDETIGIVRFVMKEIDIAGMRGIDVVNEMLACCDFREDAGYLVHMRRAEICFPSMLAGGVNRIPQSELEGTTRFHNSRTEGDNLVPNMIKKVGTELSLAVFMFHALIYTGDDDDDPYSAENEEKMSLLVQENRGFVMNMAKLIVDEITGRREPTLQEEALLRTAEFFWDLVGVAPMLSAAAVVGIPCLRLVMMRATHVLHMLYGTAAEVSQRVGSIVSTPWKIQTGTPFWQHLERAIVGCDVPVRWVHLCAENTPNRQPMRPTKGKFDARTVVSMTLDNMVGMLVTPGDKLLLAMVLLFTKQHHMPRMYTIHQTKVHAGEKVGAHGIPPVLVEVAERYNHTIAHGVQTPWYYGTC